MLTEQTLDKLYTMKLDGMAAAAKEQMSDPAALSLSFEERLGLILRQAQDRQTVGPKGKPGP